MNIFLIPLFVALLRVPYSILMGFIIIFASIGAYSVNNSMFDVWMMLGFGLLGYAMKKLKYPIVPLILAMVLGKPRREDPPPGPGPVRRKSRLSSTLGRSRPASC
ncbi:MAG: tripartite tricarboxylate transporter permease [Marinilabiliales bacterium]|nr:tripartite tricarboxylate transporter permease [Marinilabiliales bacterium]